MKFKMNNKGNFAAYLTTDMVKAVAWIILFAIIILIFASAGGIGATFNVSKIVVQIISILSKIPIWVYIIFALLWLLKIIFGGKR